MLLINGVCNHHGVLLFTKTCLLLAVLWKNNAYWSVFASDYLLTVTRHELIYVMLPSSSAAAGDLAVLVTRGSSTSNFKGLSSY